MIKPILATIHHHLLQCEPKSASQLQKSVYVDDVAYGGSCDDDALQAFKKAKTSLASGVFNLRQFQSNSAHLGSIINPDTASHSVPTVSEDASSYEHFERLIPSYKQGSWRSVGAPPRCPHIQHQRGICQRQGRPWSYETTRVVSLSQVV